MRVILFFANILYSFAVFSQPPNDEAPGAILLTVDAPCTTGFTSANATHSAQEKNPSCFRSYGFSTVWFKFIATSSAVKITDDLPDPGPFSVYGSEIALYSATNVNDYNTFSIISCDAESGNVYSPYRSTMYATGLNVGQTYYIVADSYSPGGGGKFCLTVENLTSSMLSTNNTCSSGYQRQLAIMNYTGQIAIVDNLGKLVAIVRNPIGLYGANYISAQNVYTGPLVRQDAAGNYYLDRNFKISNNMASNIIVQLFFLDSELAKLTAADPSITLNTMGITRQTGDICTNDLGITGVNSALAVTSTGSQNGVSWVQFLTPNFSNFLVNKANVVLPISIEYFKGNQHNNTNNLNWKINCTNTDSVMMIVERSNDGINYFDLYTLRETYTRCQQPFTFTDNSPSFGTNYYRLKTIDLNRITNFSQIIKFTNKRNVLSEINISPSPVIGNAILNISSHLRHETEISISSADGKIIHNQVINLEPGNNSIVLKTQSLNSGVYFITVRQGIERQVTRFIKM